MSDLVARAKAGDANAMRELLEQLGPKVHRFGCKLCPSEADAQDATQETLLHLATRLRDFEGRSAISSYAYALVRSACHRRRRGQKNQPHETLSEQLVADDRSPEQRAEAAQLSERVERALQSLSEEHREVLWLRDAEGLTAPETAEALGVSVSAVKSRLHRARVALRDAVTPLLAPEAPAAPTPACSDAVELLSKKLEGELDEGACDRMQAHLKDCDRCRAHCDAFQRALETCRSSAAGPTPECVTRAIEAALGATPA